MRLSLLLLALLLSPAALGQSAKVLNTDGFRLYQAGKYAEALEKFRAAAQADPKHALAHYNVAATLGVLRKQGQVCQHDAYRETIVEYLTTSVKLDARRLARAKVDADLDPIRDTLGWQRLLGRSPGRAADVPILLRQVTWYGPGVGVYGTVQRLRFQPGGKVLQWRRIIQDEGPPKEEEISGTYTVKGRNVEVRLPGHKPQRGSLSPEGVLTVGELGSFTDSPSECEA